MATLTYDKPRIGISSCLLGNRVRYNSEHKRNDWLVDVLAKWVSWHAVCPEVTMGLGVPRESLSLVRDTRGGPVRMVKHKSREDLTALAVATSRKIAGALPDLDGFILKRDSPSCGLERVRVYLGKGSPTRDGIGFFAQALIAERPELPMIEEGRLTDPEQREHFVSRVFAYRALKTLEARASAIQKFHQRYKLLLMSHSPAHYRKLGNIAANSAKLPPRQVKADYAEAFMAALAVRSTRGKRVNALLHALGFVKKLVDAGEKAQLIEFIDDYRDGHVPLIVPLALLSYTARKHRVDYLGEQLLFHPYPRQLGLQNEL